MMMAWFENSTAGQLPCTGMRMQACQPGAMPAYKKLSSIVTKGHHGQRATADHASHVSLLFRTDR